MTKNEVINIIRQRIRQNGTKEISGNILQNVLLQIVDLIVVGGMYYRGNIASVASINVMTDQKNGDFWLVLTGGHINEGNFDIADNTYVIWNADAHRWYQVTGMVSLDNVQPLITGAATSIVNQNLLPGRFLIASSDGKVAVSTVTMEDFRDARNNASVAIRLANNVADSLSEVDKKAQDADLAATEANRNASDAISVAQEASGKIEEFTDKFEKDVNDLTDYNGKQDEDIENLKKMILDAAAKFRGSATIAEIATKEKSYGDMYLVTDSGILDDIEVNEGDTVIWDGNIWQIIGSGGQAPKTEQNVGLGYTVYTTTLALSFTLDLSHERYFEYRLFNLLASRQDTKMNVILPNREALKYYSDKELVNEFITLHVHNINTDVTLKAVKDGDNIVNAIEYYGEILEELVIPKNTLATIVVHVPKTLSADSKGIIYSSVTMSVIPTKLVKGVQSVEVTETNIKLGHYADTSEENLALALGNGTSDSPHNALSVDWNGNMKTSGSVTDGEGNVLAKKATLTDLVVDGKVLVYSSANNGLVSLTTEELRNILMWVGTEAELDSLPESEIVEGRIYSTFDGTIKRR